MRDPDEGVDADGHVTTGVAVDRIPPTFRPLVDATARALADALGDALHSVRLYGSVATGQAVVGRSDLDLVAVLHRSVDVDLQVIVAPITDDRVRDIGVGATTLAELTAPTEQGRVERCFIDHYTVRVAGADLPWDPRPCPADVALARGFAAGLIPRLPAIAAGDLGGRDPAAVGRGLLMATAVLLSARAGGWSTDRRRAVDLLAGHPALSAGAARIWAWADGQGTAHGRPPDDLADVRRLAAWLDDAYRAVARDASTRADSARDDGHA